MHKLFRTISAVSVALLVLLGIGAMPVYAATSTTTDGVAQSYGTDASVRQGMIVGFTPSDTTKVEPLSSSRITDMLGVAISASDAPITLTGDNTTTQVYVADSGQYNVLVSNENGAIKVGDFISISALNGIGMKANSTQSRVLGKAVSAFTGSAGATSTATLKNSNGGTKTVEIGTISVNIGVVNNPTQGKGTGDLPGFLQIASSAIANKPVGAPRVYLSLAVLIVTAIIAGSLLYAGVRNGIVSVGRNPLARRSIMGSLLQVILVSVIIFILGLFAVYLLLRL